MQDFVIFSFSIHNLRKVYHGKEDVVAVDGKSETNMGNS